MTSNNNRNKSNLKGPINPLILLNLKPIGFVYTTDYKLINK